MKKGWWFLVVPPAMVLFGYIFGEVVMHLWNWLLPPLFGWHAITFWQGLGLLILCRILFGGFGGHGNDRSGWRRSRGPRWERMTPEEREKFRKEMRERWCRVGAPPSESGEPA
jgi:hypothetical protein